MSLENGPYANEYFSNCMNKYRVDPLIFIKTAQLLLFYSNQPEWPHSFSEFENIANELLGQDIYNTIQYAGQCENYDKNNFDRKITWPSDTPKGFKDDLLLFSSMIFSVIEKAKYRNIEPFRISKIAYSKSATLKRHGIKIIRNDGESLEFAVNKNDIVDIIKNFNSISSEMGD